MRYAREWAKDGIALVGDAAHTIHPLAGQGIIAGLALEDSNQLLVATTEMTKDEDITKFAAALKEALA